MKSLNITTNNKQDRDALMGILYSFGARFHENVAPGLHTLEDANKAFTDYLVLRLEVFKDSLNIVGVLTNGDVNFSTDPFSALKMIKEFVNRPNSIVVKNVGDYEAEIKDDGIHIYGQHISFEKFDEIVEAFEKLNK